MAVQYDLPIDNDLAKFADNCSEMIQGLSDYIDDSKIDNPIDAYNNKLCYRTMRMLIETVYDSIVSFVVIDED